MVEKSTQAIALARQQTLTTYRKAKLDRLYGRLRESAYTKSSCVYRALRQFKAHERQRQSTKLRVLDRCMSFMKAQLLRKKKNVLNELRANRDVSLKKQEAKSYSKAVVKRFLGTEPNAEREAMFEEGLKAIR